MGCITKDGSVLDHVLALFDLGSEVNAMHLVFAERLNFIMRATNFGTQKIDGMTLKTYGMVVAAISVTHQAGRVRFFEETFLVANISPDVVLGIFFLTLSNADVDFPKKKLR